MKLKAQLRHGNCLVFGQAVVPGLKFVEDQGRRGVLKQLQQDLVAGDLGFLVAQPLPFSPAIATVRMVVEQQVPEELVALAVQALGDDMHAGAQGDLADLGVAQGVGPVVQPVAGGRMVGQGVIERRHQVRFSLPPLALEGDGATLARTRRRDGLDDIVGRIGDAQKVLRGDLGRTGVVFVRQLNGGAFQAAAFELVA